MPAAVLFDLTIGRADVRPDAQMGYQACLDAKGVSYRRMARDELLRFTARQVGLPSNRVDRQAIEVLAVLQRGHLCQTCLILPRRLFFDPFCAPVVDVG